MWIIFKVKNSLYTGITMVNNNDGHSYLEGQQALVQQILFQALLQKHRAINR